MKDKELRALANEVWSHAATIDGLMRCLRPIIRDAEERGRVAGVQDAIDILNDQTLSNHEAFWRVKGLLL